MRVLSPEPSIDDLLAGCDDSGIPPFQRGLAWNRQNISLPLEDELLTLLEHQALREFGGAVQPPPPSLRRDRSPM